MKHRVVENPVYPKIVFLETLGIFFGANFIYHQNVFRRTNNRLQFASFLVINAFTSW